MSSVAVISIPTRSGEEAHFAKTAESIVNRNRTRQTLPALTQENQDQFIFTGGKRHDVDVAFHELEERGIQNFDKIYLQCHGNETSVELSQGVKNSFSAAELAQKFLIEGGLRAAIAKHLEGSLIPRNKSPRKGNDFKLTIRLLSCLTGNELTEAERSGQFASAKSTSFVDDFARAIMRDIAATVQTYKLANPDKFDAAAFSITLRAKAPQKWNVVLPDGSMLGYFTSSKKEAKTDALFRRNFDKLKDKDSVPENLQPFVLPDHEKSTEVIYGIRKNPYEACFTATPVGPRACK